MTATKFDNSAFSGLGTIAGQAEDNAAPMHAPTGNELEWGSSHEDVQHRTTGRHRPIRRQDIAEITSQLAIMTRSGIDVASALGSLANQCQKPALKQVLIDVHDSVLSGSTLSSALGMHAEVFDQRFIATVAAGEASGKMAEVLQQLSQVQRSEIRLQRTMKALMTYPVLLMTVSSAVIVALVLFVLPRFADIFEQYDLTLPVITQLLIAISTEFRSRWWLWGPAFASAVTGLLVWRKTAVGRRWLDALWLKLVIIQSVYRPQIVGRMCRILGLMLESGVPLLECLRLSKQALGNVHYQDLIDELEDAVVNGRGLGCVLQTAEIVPQSAREMIITAESTGNLGEVTQLLGEYYEEEAEARMRQVVGMLEPIITVVMGAIVAVVVLAVMLPVFDLSTLAQGGR